MPHGHMNVKFTQQAWSKFVFIGWILRVPAGLSASTLFNPHQCDTKNTVHCVSGAHMTNVMYKVESISTLRLSRFYTWSVLLLTETAAKKFEVLILQIQHIST
jgi:hypothetical protein